MFVGNNLTIGDSTFSLFYTLMGFKGSSWSIVHYF